MLDVIADFWKPVKKAPTQEKFQPELLQVGSSLGFGFVPQVILSGRRLHVSAINTYLFGDEALTSFVLTQDKDPGVSMIVAESDGEYYLAISRRISLNDRMKLFDGQELGNILTRQDITRLACRDNIVDYKGWLVSAYKREIQNLKGGIVKGDYRKIKAPSTSDGLEFEYTLLVSDSNEHAIEIEKYNDGRIEVYATVYRRLNDIGEITNPPLLSTSAVTQSATPDLKIAPKMTEAPVAPVVSVEPVKATAIKLQEFAAAALPVAEPVVTQPTVTKPANIRPEFAMKADYLTNAPTQDELNKKEQKMATLENINGTRSDMNNTETMKPKLYVQPNAPEAFNRQEVKTVSNRTASSYDSDSIECDLRVANKIIDEAIRNEMRLTDIVRRIIELPVAYPESVQIPITLTDEDYALLAIRYGIASSDRNAIKRRILEDLNDFSGDKKAA